MGSRFSGGWRFAEETQNLGCPFPNNSNYLLANLLVFLGLDLQVIRTPPLVNRNFISRSTIARMDDEMTWRFLLLNRNWVKVESDGLEKTGGILYDL